MTTLETTGCLLCTRPLGDDLIGCDCGARYHAVCRLRLNQGCVNADCAPRVRPRFRWPDLRFLFHVATLGSLVILEWTTHGDRLAYVPAASVLASVCTMASLCSYLGSHRWRSRP